MAIIKNQIPPVQPLSSDYKCRVVVKFKPDIQLPYSGAINEVLEQRLGSAWVELNSRFHGLRLAPYFSTIEEGQLRQFALGEAPGTTAKSQTSFLQYYAIECPEGVEAKAIADELRSWPTVETAYVEGGPTPPPLNPSDDPRSINQGYLDAAPGGINARAVWPTADGGGIGFVDLEQGWTLDHEDLAAANITIISGVSQAYHGHGTAVLGEVSAVDNTRGGIGIAPGATARVVSQWQTASTYNTAEAILSAAVAMSAGDVLLLEAQTSHPNASGYVPVEVEQAVFDAIQYATSQGIVVVEAGANGSVDLDTFQDYDGKQILNRTSTDFRDSGAIMVGAASSTAPHQRLSFSNYGSRIDCFAWGENIDTCGDGWTGTSTTAYTTSFGGTSGASPIIAGAALLLQSWAVRIGRAIYTPQALRDVLSDANLHTHSANPGNDRIGVMPDLQKLIGSSKPKPFWLDVLAWAWLILLGALLITPGGILCIKCGSLDPGYLGDTAINLLGIISIGLGIYGFVQRTRNKRS